MKEYRGLLMGGPDDGNYVTASKDKIPVTTTIEMWLDGDGRDKDVNIIVVKGNYIWQKDEFEDLFMWQRDSYEISIRKPQFI